MLLDICLGSKSVWRILILYGESPGAGFTRQELKEHTKLGNKALSFALKRLAAFGILIKKKEELPLTIYKLNMGSSYVEDILRILNREKQDINHLRYDFAVIVREFSRRVIDSVDAIGLYLFGSVAKRTYRDDSDIDFAVVLSEKNPKDDMKMNAIADELSKKFKRKIQYFILTPEQISSSRKRTELTEEILKHGIRVI